MTLQHLRTLCICVALLAIACDPGVAAKEVVIHTNPDGKVMDPGGSCSIVYEASTAPKGDFSTIGPIYATSIQVSKGNIVSQYFIAKQGYEDKEVTLDNGEFAIEIDADSEFLKSGDVKNATFETYDGHKFEVYLWGEADCEGELPSEPPK